MSVPGLVESVRLWGHADKRRRSTRFALSGSGLLVLVVSWPLFVFTGSQIWYLVAAAGVALTMVDLTTKRSGFVAPYLIFIVGVIGTEASGELGRGAAPLGSLRLLDWALFVGVVNLFLNSGMTRSIRLELRGRVRSDPAAALLVSLIAYATAVWIARGAPVDSLLRTDLRLVLLAGSTWYVVTRCLSGKTAHLLLAVCALAPLLALKSGAIYITEFWTIGQYDRLQSSTIGAGVGHRVVLIGGDTVLVILPALAIVAMRSVRGGLTIALAGCSLMALAGLLVSGTRSSLIVAVAACVAISGLAVVEHRRVAIRTVVGALVAIALVAGGAFATQTVERFTTPDAPHVGVNFRKDEARDFLRLPPADLALGRGLGGGHTGKDVRGQPIESGWLHAFPLWVILKTGAFGLLATMLLIVMAGRVAFRRLQCDEATHVVVLAGSVTLAALLLISLAVNRIALPEGAVLAPIAVAWLLRPPTRDGCAS